MACINCGVITSAWLCRTASLWMSAIACLHSHLLVLLASQAGAQGFRSARGCAVQLVQFLHLAFGPIYSSRERVREQGMQNRREARLDAELVAKIEPAHFRVI